jgi:acetyl-CoA C-acetyltransferase
MAGGPLREVSARELAMAATAAVLEKADLEPADLGVVVISCGLIGTPDELGLAAELRDAIGAGSSLCAQLSGSFDLGMGALGMVQAAVERSGRPALLVGVEASSRAPYWASGLRWGASAGEAEVVDPVGALLAAQKGRGGGGDRSAEDEFALRSRRLIGESGRDREGGPLQAVAAVAGVEADLPPAERSPQELAALMPAFDESGTVTAANSAAPADGAAAVLLVPGAKGPSLAPPAAAPELALERAGLEPGDLEAAELYEGSAAEVLSLSGSIGIDAGKVNVGGGAIGQGSPFAAAGVLMALRLGSRLGPGETGLLAGPACAAVIRG